MTWSRRSPVNSNWPPKSTLSVTWWTSLKITLKIEKEKGLVLREGLIYWRSTWKGSKMSGSFTWRCHLLQGLMYNRGSFIWTYEGVIYFRSSFRQGAHLYDGLIYKLHSWGAYLHEGLKKWLVYTRASLTNYIHEGLIYMRSLTNEWLIYTRASFTDCAHEGLIYMQG